MPSDNIFGQNDKVKNQSQLPPKKRFGAKLENSCFTISAEPETHNNLRIQKQQKITNKMELDLQKPEAKQAKIIPGVIRHTSCPDTYLAYYYNYSVN